MKNLWVFTLLLIMTTSSVSAQILRQVPLPPYLQIFIESPAGNIVIPTYATPVMIARRNPLVVTFVPREGVPVEDFYVILYGPDKKAVVGYYANSVAPKVFGIDAFWSSFKTGSYLVALVHPKGAINVVLEYALSNRSRGRPIKSFDRNPEEGKDGFNGTYELKEQSDVSWRIQDTRCNAIRREKHGTRTANKVYNFHWDRKKDNGQIASAGSYQMGVLAQPKDEPEVSPDEQGKPIKVND